VAVELVFVWSFVAVLAVWPAKAGAAARLSTIDPASIAFIM
jgi:hypothetical protein